jgi:hypothetical protein
LFKTPALLLKEKKNLVMSFSISYPDLIIFPYVADTTERGGDRGPNAEEIGGETEGDFIWTTLMQYSNL